MAFEQHYSPNRKSTTTTEIKPENCKGCFDCNICLDSAHEPVVTLCGHLYCWPCIYKWLHLQSPSLDIHEPRPCPVCKAEISNTSMVPLYGQGNPKFEPNHLSLHGIPIPRRPRASHNPYQDHNYGFDGSAAGFHNLVVGMFGEMVFARVFGNSDSLFGYTNPYGMLRGGNSRSSSSRPRRLEIRADKCLNKISIFLFCCFLLCLIVF